MDKNTPAHPTPKPGDYPVGSPQSRAAARAMLKEEEKFVIKIHFVRTLGAPMAKKPFKVSHGPDATLEFYR